LVHGGTIGPEHDSRSQIMNSSTRSCDVSGAAAPHSAGKRAPGAPVGQPPLLTEPHDVPLPPPDEVLTWKSLKMAWPHVFCGLAPTGVSNV
jgi:hypothetical protein